MTLPTELLNKGFVTTGPTGRIVRFSTAKMLDRPAPGMIREGAEIIIINHHLTDDDKENATRAVLNMNDALAACEALIEAGFQVDVASGAMMMLVFEWKPYVEPAAYIWVWRDVASLTGSDALWATLEDLAAPWGGSIDNVGEFGPGQAPHGHVVPGLAEPRDPSARAGLQPAEACGGGTILPFRRQ